MSLRKLNLTILFWEICQIICSSSSNNIRSELKYLAFLKEIFGGQKAKRRIVDVDVFLVKILLTALNRALKEYDFNKKFLRAFQQFDGSRVL